MIEVRIGALEEAGTAAVVRPVQREREVSLYRKNGRPVVYVIGELSGGSGLAHSGRAGLGAWLGMVVATAVKLALVFLMIGIFGHGENRVRTAWTITSPKTPGSSMRS